MERRELSSSEEVLDLLTRPKRDRSWEEGARKAQGQVTYRGVPSNLHMQVKALAASLDVNVGEVVRAFLEYGLQAYQAGQLPLRPAVVQTKKSLYPPK
jgi:hypothetical protein